MKHVVASLTIGACLLVSSAGVVFAVDAHKAPGGGPWPEWYKRFRCCSVRWHAS